MFGIGLAWSIIKDNKEYPKRVGILWIVILIVWLIFLLSWLFSLWGIFEYIWLIILIFVWIIAFYLIAD